MAECTLQWLNALVNTFHIDYPIGSATIRWSFIACLFDLFFCISPWTRSERCNIFSKICLSDSRLTNDSWFTHKRAHQITERLWILIFRVFKFIWLWTFKRILKIHFTRFGCACDCRQNSIRQMKSAIHICVLITDFRTSQKRLVTKKVYPNICNYQYNESTIINSYWRSVIFIYSLLLCYCFCTACIHFIWNINYGITTSA